MPIDIMRLDPRENILSRGSFVNFDIIADEGLLDSTLRFFASTDPAGANRDPGVTITRDTSKTSTDICLSVTASASLFGAQSGPHWVVVADTNWNVIDTEPGLAIV